MSGLGVKHGARVLLLRLLLLVVVLQLAAFLPFATPPGHLCLGRSFPLGKPEKNSHRRRGRRHDADCLLCSVATSSVQNELVPALVRRQFRNCTTGGEPLAKRATSVAVDALHGEAMVARMSR